MIATATGALFVAMVVAVHVAILRIRFKRQMARRARFAAGTPRRRVRLNAWTDRSADIRGVANTALSALGVLLPMGDEDRAKIATSLGRAGFRAGNALAVVIGIKAICVLAGLIAGAGVATGFGGALAWSICLVGGLLAGVIVNLVPELVLARLGTRRLKRIQGGLAETFDLLIVCLESGLTFERAVQRTVRDLRAFQPPLAEELGQASLDMSVYGMTREDALTHLAERLESQHFKDFAMTVAQSERHGTPLADSLRKLAASMRVQTISAMQARMARLPVLLVVPTITLVLPGILVMLAGPALIRLTEQLGG